MKAQGKAPRHGVPVSVRLAKPIYEEVKAAQTKADDRNLTQTVERLLSKALEEDSRSAGILEPALALKYGPAFARVILAIAEVMETVGRLAVGAKYGKSKPFSNWPTDAYAFDQAVKAAQLVLDHARPGDEIVAPPPVEDEERASKFWETSYRYFLDHPPLDDLRRALAGEPGRGDPFLYHGFWVLGQQLNDNDDDGAA